MGEISETTPKIDGKVICEVQGFACKVDAAPFETGV
jgi:hypothetical protein